MSFKPETDICQHNYLIIVVNDCTISMLNICRTHNGCQCSQTYHHPFHPQIGYLTGQGVGTEYGLGVGGLVGCAVGEMIGAFVGRGTGLDRSYVGTFTGK